MIGLLASHQHLLRVLAQASALGISLALAIAIFVPLEHFFAVRHDGGRHRRSRRVIGLALCGARCRSPARSGAFFSRLLGFSDRPQCCQGQNDQIPLPISLHELILGYYDPETQHEVWDANPDALIASSIALAAGRARGGALGLVQR